MKDVNNIDTEYLTGFIPAKENIFIVTNYINLNATIAQSRKTKRYYRLNVDGSYTMPADGVPEYEEDHKQILNKL